MGVQSMALIKGSNGLNEVLKNLNAAVRDLQVKGTGALITAGVLVRNQGQKETPVETSNLVQSWYGPEPRPSVRGPVVEIGLTAAYAPYVHEMVGANFRGPRPSATSPARREGGKPTAKAKFLEDPLKDNEKRILDIIAKAVRINR
jgi:hypothetical protein